MNVAPDSSGTIGEIDKHAPHINARCTGAFTDLDELRMFHDVTDLLAAGDEKGDHLTQFSFERGFGFCLGYGWYFFLGHWNRFGRFSLDLWCGIGRGFGRGRGRGRGRGF